MTNVKFNKNRVAKGVSTVLTSSGSGAIWAAGASVALKSNFHPAIKLVYCVGSAVTGVLLQRATQKEAEELIDELWPEENGDVEINFGIDEPEIGL